MRGSALFPLILGSLLAATAQAACPAGRALRSNGTYAGAAGSPADPCDEGVKRLQSAVEGAAPLPPEVLPEVLIDPSLHAYRDKLESTGWCCAKPSDTGLTCRGRMPEGGYPEDVVMMIPPFYAPESSVPLSVFLHGHLFRTDPDTRQLEDFDSVLKEFALDAKHALNRRNSILVIPASQGRNTTYKQWFNVGRVVGQDGGKAIQGKGQFPEFLQFILNQAQAAGLSQEAQLGKVSFTCHSGGCYPVAGALAQKCKPGLPCVRSSVQDLFMMDAAFEVPLPGQDTTVLDALIRFRKEHPEVPVCGVAQDSRKNSTYLLQKITGSKWKDSFLDVSDLRADPRRQADESDEDFLKRRLAAEEGFKAKLGAALEKGMESNRYFLAYSGSDHWSVVNEFLPLFWGSANP